MRKQARRRRHRVPDVPVEDSVEEELYLLNAGSPFVRLPTETRNRIYVLLFSVGQIHVCHRRCYRPSTDAATSLAATPPSCSLPRTTRGQAARPVAPCGRPSSTARQPLRASLTLLSAVCRQLHAETAVLPFCLNAWSFENAAVMERYLVRERRLSLLQRRAISSLVARERPSPALETCLGGLRLILCRNGNMTKRFERAAPSSGRDLRWHLYD